MHAPDVSWNNLAHPNRLHRYQAFFFDGWRAHPTLETPSNLPSVGTTTHRPLSVEPTRPLEEDARDMLATAAKNQAEDGPSTRRAAIRACKYLRAMANQHGDQRQAVYNAAKVHAQRSRGTTATETGKYQLKERDLQQ